MSEEAAQAFIERMKSDEDFRAKVMAEEGVEARMALIGAEGFDCSAEEIGAAQDDWDAELDDVVGGMEPGCMQYEPACSAYCPY